MGGVGPEGKKLVCKAGPAFQVSSALHRLGLPHRLSPEPGPGPGTQQLLHEQLAAGASHS